MMMKSTGSLLTFLMTRWFDDFQRCFLHYSLTHSAISIFFYPWTRTGHMYSLGEILIHSHPLWTLLIYFHGTHIIKNLVTVFNSHTTTTSFDKHSHLDGCSFSCWWIILQWDGLSANKCSNRMVRIIDGTHEW